MFEQLIGNLDTVALARALVGFSIDAVGALVFLVVSWMVAGWVRRAIRRGFEKTEVDDTLGIFLSNAARVTGTVIEIGLFTTSFDTGDNRRIFVPNALIFGGTIENVTYHDTRRVNVSVGTDYGADLDAAGIGIPFPQMDVQMGGPLARNS